jgi:hypothetical protein
MGTWWKRIEGFANRIGIWFTMFVALTAIFGWVTSHLVLFRSYGWPEATLAGILITCVVLFAVSAGLMAWRYFSPSSNANPSIFRSYENTEFGKRLADAETAIQFLVEKGARHISTPELAAELRGKIEEIQRQIKIDAPNASTVYEAFQNLEQANLSQNSYIRDDVRSFIDKYQSTYLDVAHLLHFTLLQATDGLLTYLLSIAPKRDAEASENSELNAESFATNSEFLGEVSRKLSGTNRSSDYSAIMAKAEADSDERLRVLPTDQWPAGVNPVELRRYFIGAFQRRRMIEYLEYQLRTIKESIYNNRSVLVERLNLRER